MTPRAPAPARTFFDTSVLVYAHDASEPRKRDVARRLLLEHLGAGTFCTSVQVLAEYFSVVTTKGEARLDAASARWLVEQLPADDLVAAGPRTLRSAARLCAATAAPSATGASATAAAGLSIWDALVVETAIEAGAQALYSEDARLLRAVAAAVPDLRAEDPFAGAHEHDASDPFAAAP